MKETCCWSNGSAYFASANKYFKFITQSSPLLALLGVLAASPAFGQAPGLIWSTNVGGTVIGIDGQTNVYAEVNNTGITTLNSTGASLQTNTMCPFPATAKRDAAGNYYFADTITVPENFG